MATTPTPTPKVSWLKKFGQDVMKVLGYVNTAEKLVEKPIELALPGSVIGFSLWDEAFAIVTNVEAGFAAITAAPTGVAKFQAVLPVVSQLLDQWVTDNLPGSAQILAADTYIQSKVTVATNLTNTVVQFLNSLPASASTVVSPNAQAVATAVKAITKSNPAIAAAVTTGAKA